MNVISQLWSKLRPVAEIGHFDWRGKHGEFSESFFSPGMGRALAEVEGVEPLIALDIVPFWGFKPA